MGKFTKTGPRSVACSDGWSVREAGSIQGSAAVIYSEAETHRSWATLGLGQKTEKSLRFGVVVGRGSAGKTLLDLQNSAWRWQGSTSGEEIADVDKPKIIERLCTALQFLGYEVDPFALEVRAGIRPLPANIWGYDGASAELVDGQKLRFFCHGKVVTLPVVLGRLKTLPTPLGAGKAGVAEIRLADLAHWDPPHEGEKLSLPDLQVAAANFSHLLQRQGYTVLLTKSPES
jgi:hypothetical protein